jgi:hypothetical protein
MRGVHVVRVAAILMANVVPAAAQAQTRPALQFNVGSVTVSSATNRLDTINRLLSLDRDGDGRISRDELPERMALIFDRGDRDRDDALTPQEVHRLVDEASLADPAKPVLVEAKRITMADVVADLRLSGVKGDTALSLARGHRVADTNLGNIAHAQLYEWLVYLLDADEYENFVAAAARANRGGVVFVD